MKKLDFISGAPKTFIFQQDSNKTNLGGILTVLFIIAMIVIIYAYLYEYFANDKYNVTYLFTEEHYTNEEMYAKFDDKLLFPEITYSLDIDYNSLGNITNDILILDRYAKEIPLWKEITSRVNYLFFGVFFKCKNESNCTFKSLNNNNIELIDLYLDYTGFICDHQNPDSPIKKEKRFKYFPFSIEEGVSYYFFNWKIINYEEESSFSGMFKKTKKFYGGEFTKPEKYKAPYENITANKTDDETGISELYKLVAVIQFYQSNNFISYDKYTRSRVTIWSSISDICALISSLYGIVTFIFCGIYSNSFDNYKIIEKIVSSTSSLHMKEEQPKEHIELANRIESDKGDTLIEVNEDKDDKNIIDDDNIKKNTDLDSRPLFKIPKFHFYDFLYNNIYSDNCCKTSPTQEMLSTCNDIITKYYSIDAVIYNQLRLENLFRDYKWNNPKLNNITNNDLISQIKTISGNLIGT